MVQAQDATGHYALSATGGVVAFDLPDISVPVFTGGGVTGAGAIADDYAVGGLFGVSAAFSTGLVGDYEVRSKGFAAFGQRSLAASQTLTGTGTLVIPGITTPTGTITLLTDPAGRAPRARSLVRAPTSIRP